MNFSGNKGLNRHGTCRTYQKQHITTFAPLRDFRLHRRALRRLRRFFACSSTTRHDSDAIWAVCIHAAASMPNAAQHSNAIGDPDFKTGKRSATDSLLCRGGESRHSRRRATCGRTSRCTYRRARRSGLDGAASSGEDIAASSITGSERVRSDPCTACAVVARLAEVLSSGATARCEPSPSCCELGVQRGQMRTVRHVGEKNEPHKTNNAAGKF